MKTSEIPSELTQATVGQVSQFAPVEISEVSTKSGKVLYRLVVADEICLNYATLADIDIYLMGVARGHRLNTPTHGVEK